MADQTDSSQPATPWNKGKRVGQNPPFRLQEIWTVRTRLLRAWSRWVFEAPTTPDGIRYPARTLPSGENNALFDRCLAALAEADLGPLATWRSDAGGLDIADILEARGWGLV